MRGFFEVELRLDICLIKKVTFCYQLQAVSRDRHALVPKQSPGSGSHEPLVSDQQGEVYLPSVPNGATAYLQAVLTTLHARGLLI